MYNALLQSAASMAQPGPAASSGASFLDLVNNIAAGKDTEFDAASVWSKLAPRRQAQQETGFTNDELRRLMLQVGLGMMGEGSQPGATVLGSLGKAGAAGVADVDKRRKEKRDEDRDFQREDQDAIRLLMGMGSQVGDRNFQREKFGHETEMDAARLGLDKQRLGMEGSRLAMDAERMANEQARLARDAEEIIQGDDGISYIFNKDTNQLTPLTYNDMPFKGANRNDVMNEILRGAITKTITDYNPLIDDVPLDEKLRGVSENIKSLSSPQGTPKNNRKTGAPKIGQTFTGKNGITYRFRGGNPKDPKSYEQIR